MSAEVAKTRLRDDPARPGWATSEFWLTVLLGVAPVYTLIVKPETEPSTQSVAVIAFAIATVIYTVWRSLAKRSEIERRTQLDAMAIASATQTATSPSGQSEAITSLVVEPSLMTVPTTASNVGVIEHAVNSFEEPLNPGEVKRSAMSLE